MSRTNTNINYVITANAGGAVTAFRQVGNELDRLKQVTGGRGPLKDAFELLAGGGAVAGIGFAVNQVERMSKAFDEAHGAFHRGEIGLLGFLDKAARGVPIIGDIAGAIDHAGNAILRMVAGFDKLDLDRIGKLRIGGNSDSQQAELERGRREVARMAAARGGPDGVRRFELDEIDRERAGLDGRRKRAEISLAFQQERDQQLLTKKREIMLATADAANKADFESAMKSSEELTREDKARAQELLRHAGEQRRAREAAIGSAFDARRDTLEQRRNALQDAIQRGATDSPRFSATAQAVTSVGAAEVLAASQRRSSDPGIKVMQEQKQKLESIEKELKELNRFAKAQAAINLGIQSLFPTAGTN